MLAFGIVFLVCALMLHTSSAATPRHPTEELPIRYPEPIDVKTEDIVPASCKHLTYCTVKPKDYPEEKFNNMLKGYKPLPQPSMIVELKNRQGDPDDEDNCESEVTYEPLYTVREKVNEPWRMVVQAPGQDFVQRIRIESCKCTVLQSLHSSARICDFLQTKVNTWEVLVAKGKNETELIKAELPVCCSCHYRPIDFLTRFGKPKE